MFCPHSVFVFFVWISEQTAIISLLSINWLAYITERECVFTAGLSPVRAGFDPRSVHVRFVVDKKAQGQFFLPVLQIPCQNCSRSFQYNCFIRFAGARYGRSINVCSGTVGDKWERLYGERLKRENVSNGQRTLAVQ